MRNRDLEKKMSQLQELIDLWNRFYEMTNVALKGAEFTEEHNRDFLELKSSIARKYQAFTDKFPKKTLPDEEVNNVLAVALSFEHLKKLTSFAADEFQNLWHRVYISLNRMLGHLENEREELRKVSRMGLFIRKVIRSKMFKLLFILLVIIGILFAGYKLDMFPPAEVDGEEEAGETEQAWSRVRRVIYSLVEKLRRESSEPTPE